MIFFFPGRLVALQELKQAFAADGIARGLYDEGAAAARANQGVDIADEIFGKNNVCADGSHIKSVTYEWELGKSKVNSQ